jgi:hypothetical protein
VRLAVGTLVPGSCGWAGVLLEEGIVYFRDGDLLPENQEPLIITAAPYSPSWRPDDYPGEIPVGWDGQVAAAVAC